MDITDGLRDKIVLLPGWIVFLGFLLFWIGVWVICIGMGASRQQIERDKRGVQIRWEKQK